MKKAKSSSGLLLIFLASVINLNSFSQATNSFQHIEQKIKDEIDKGTLPSVAIAVAKDGKIIYEKAFGWSDIQAKLSATINTAYQLASVSKPMTATGLMVLDHKKQIHIDSSAGIYMNPLQFKHITK